MRNTIRPSQAHEQTLWEKGYRLIAGVDEAGRGAWAGPVVAAAVVLPIQPTVCEDLVTGGVKDSKLVSPHQRMLCRKLIEQYAISYAIGISTHIEIDAIGILSATRLAMIRAVDGLSEKPDALIIDAVTLSGCDIAQDVFYHADSISISVAAASILAKTQRDQYMCALDLQVPGYGFAFHKGYGTKMHQSALASRGISWAHRRSYAPIRRLVESLEPQPNP